jgi:hypothetical protein
MGVTTRLLDPHTMVLFLIDRRQHIRDVISVSRNMRIADELKCEIIFWHDAVFRRAMHRQSSEQ